MDYSAKEIARYIIDFSWDNSQAVSNLRLQKLLYFVQAEFLVSTGEACFEDSIHAWNFGPVVPSVYYEYRMFGGTSIPSKGTNSRHYDINKEDKEIINGIVEYCNQFTTSQLVQFTHNQEPWRKASRSLVSDEITIDSIKEYFSED